VERRPRAPACICMEPRAARVWSRGPWSLRLALQRASSPRLRVARVTEAAWSATWPACPTAPAWRRRRSPGSLSRRCPPSPLPTSFGPWARRSAGRCCVCCDFYHFDHESGGLL
jgi:hypothetical protein